MDSAIIHGLLRLRHDPIRGEWAYFGEFQPGTGSSNTSGRRWDAFAVSCWGERKGHRIAYEIKVSRSDWLRELKDPGKRSLAERLCHETWFIGPSGIILPEEVPEGWGLLTVAGSTLRTIRAAPQRTTVETPDSFIAALARRGAEDGEMPRPLPRAAWRFAGVDVAQEDLLATCTAILERNVEEMVKAKVQREVWELTHEKRDGDRVMQVLRDVMEQPDVSAFGMERWIRGRTKTDLSEIVRDLENLLAKTRRMT